MKIKKFISVIIPLCFLLANKGFGQVTLHVTDPVQGNSSASFDQVVNQAITSANSGQNVTILFNASGLCQMTSPVSPISISSGSITFDKDPAATVEQGLDVASGSVGYGILVSGNAASTSVTIQNLSFKNFGIGINLYSSSHCSVSNCLVDDNGFGILLNNLSKDILIQSNQFHNNSTAVGYVNSVTNISSGFTVQIKSNTITAGTNDFGIQVISSAEHDITTFEIEDNTIYNADFGILVFNNTTTPDNWANLMENVNVNSNVINGCQFGFFFDNPIDWVVENNTFNDFGSVSRFADIFMTGDPLPNLNRINFIKSGVLFPDQAFDNNIGNVWTGTSEYSFYVIGYYGGGVRLINLDLKAPVHIVDGISTEVRECKIKKFGTTAPITLDNGNDNIAKPTLSSASISGNSLSVDYQLNSNVAGNASFSVDFYKANANGDLLEYLGTDATITTLTGGTYTANITIPTGVVFGGTDKIGVTVTGHFHWTDTDNPITSEVAYIVPEIICPQCNISQIAGTPACVGKPKIINNFGSNCQLMYDFGDGSATSTIPIHTYTSIGTYTLQVTTIVPEGCEPQTVSMSMIVDDCGETVSCADCIGSFAPVPGEKYVVSAWVQQSNSETDITYTEPNIKLNYTGGGSSGPYIASGAIIDGWQRIDAVFTVPIGATEVFVQLNNSSASKDVFFDDIRIHPLKASLKSFVYDPISMRLMAELDENNYATFYEYDEEGALIRVKKETERGVKTIKEAGNNTRKKP